MVRSTILFLLITLCVAAQDAPLIERPKASDYWTITTVPHAPENARIEVSGLTFLDHKRLLVASRRGQIWQVTDPASQNAKWSLWAEGLQEPLGLLTLENGVHCVQRGELTRITDRDGDGRADRLLTLCDDWPLSGNYHEYAFGPVQDADGAFWVTLNKPFGGEPFGRVPWRGWAVRVMPDGTMQGMVAGLRSPAGVEKSPQGELFYTDNQGEWCGASKLAHLQVGEFHGHPWGIESCKLEASRVEHPGKIPNGILMPEAARTIPRFKLPAVWFPYDKMGRSPAGFLWDRTGGTFGPFAGQILVGDQYAATVMRCDLEQVKGHWQGACFPFLSGFESGVLRLVFAEDGTLYVGSTDRGWGSRGPRSESLERVRWTGKTPFAIQTMRARPDGFRLTLTKPVDPESIDLSKITMKSYTYRLHAAYGSAEMDTKELVVSAARSGPDARTFDLVVEGLREGYVHELKLVGVRDADGVPLLHEDAYYTLIHRP